MELTLHLLVIDERTLFTGNQANFATELNKVKRLTCNKSNVHKFSKPRQLTGRRRSSEPP